jgi:hypothetical protein
MIERDWRARPLQDLGARKVKRAVEIAPPMDGADDLDILIDEPEKLLGGPADRITMPGVDIASRRAHSQIMEDIHAIGSPGYR